MVTRCGCNLTIIPFVYFGYILHTAVNNLNCVSDENFMWSVGLCKKLLDLSKKNFVTIVNAVLLNGGLNEIIFPDLVIGFWRWFLVYLQVTLKPLLFRTFSYSHFALLNVSSLDEFSTVSVGSNSKLLYGVRWVIW